MENTIQFSFSYGRLHKELVGFSIWSPAVLTDRDSAGCLWQESKQILADCAFCPIPPQLVYGVLDEFQIWISFLISALSYHPVQCRSYIYIYIYIYIYDRTRIFHGYVPGEREILLLIKSYDYYSYDVFFLIIIKNIIVQTQI